MVYQPKNYIKNYLENESLEENQMNQNLSFMAWLEPKLENGEKTRTIRAMGKNNYRDKMNIGDIAHIWINQRSKNRKFLFDRTIKDKYYFQLKDIPLVSDLEAKKLESPIPNETWYDLAHNDGFKSYLEFIEFFTNHPTNDTSFVIFLWENPKFNEIFKIGTEQQIKEDKHLIELRLVKGDTKIFIRNKNGYFQEFIQCKYLLLHNPQETVKNQQELTSIDQLAENYIGRHEQNQKGYEKVVRSLSKEEEFKGHCSNLQAWFEHDYNTRLLRRNLAFPLLNRLAQAGDPKALKMFKSEIAERIEESREAYDKGLMKNVSTQEYIINRGYLNQFTYEELESIFDLFVFEELHQHSVYKLFDSIIIKHFFPKHDSTKNFNWHEQETKVFTTSGTKEYERLMEFLFTIYDKKNYPGFDLYLLNRLNQYNLDYKNIKLIKERIDFDLLDEERDGYAMRQFNSYYLKIIAKKTNNLLEELKEDQEQHKLKKEEIIEKILKHFNKTNEIDVIQHTIFNIALFDFNYFDYKRILESLKVNTKDQPRNAIAFDKKLLLTFSKAIKTPGFSFYREFDFLSNHIKVHSLIQIAYHNQFQEDYKQIFGNMSFTQLRRFKSYIVKQQRKNYFSKSLYLFKLIDSMAKSINYDLDKAIKVRDRDIIDRIVGKIYLGTKSFTFEETDNLIEKLKKAKVFYTLKESYRTGLLLKFIEKIIPLTKDDINLFKTEVNKKLFTYINIHILSGIIKRKLHLHMNYQQLCIINRFYNSKKNKPANYKTFQTYLREQTCIIRNQKFIQTKIEDFLFTSIEKKEKFIQQFTSKKKPEYKPIKRKRRKK